MIEPNLTRIALTLAVSAVLAGPAPAQEETADEVTAAEVQAEISEAFAAIADYSADRRDEALAQARESLDTIDSEIGKLEQRARENWAEMSEAARERTAATLDTLRERRNRLGEMYGAMTQGTESAWDEIKQGFARAWDELKAAWEAAVAEDETNQGQ